MTVEEAISKLMELRKKGYGKLILAVTTKGVDKEVKTFDVQLSCDGVGQFIEVEYD